MVALARTEGQRNLTAAAIKGAIHDYQGYVTQIEKSLNIGRTVVVGDMNLDPYDEAWSRHMLSHAVMAKDLARDVVIEPCLASRRRFCYNPMWSFFREIERPARQGTYPYTKVGFDCVLLEICSDQILTSPRKSWTS